MRSVHILACTLCLCSFAWAKPTAQVLAYQDSLGQYSFGYSAPGSARSEIRKLNGETRGAYSYIDDAGVVQTTSYAADGKSGFRVTATNLPQGPASTQATEETVAAKQSDQVQAEGTKPNELRTKDGSKIFVNPYRPPKGTKPVETTDKVESPVKEGETKTPETEGAKEEPKSAEGEKSEDEKEKEENAHEVQVRATPSENDKSKVSEASSGRMIHGILKESSIPVFQISEGGLLIENPAVLAPINIPAFPITPASTSKLGEEASMESEKPATKESPGSMEKASTEESEKASTEKAEEQDKQTDLSKEIITTLHILPLDHTYSALLRYTPVQYIIY